MMHVSCVLEMYSSSVDISHYVFKNYCIIVCRYLSLRFQKLLYNRERNLGFKLLLYNNNNNYYYYYYRHLVVLRWRFEVNEALSVLAGS